MHVEAGPLGEMMFFGVCHVPTVPGSAPGRVRTGLLVGFVSPEIENWARPCASPGLPLGPGLRENQPVLWGPSPDPGLGELILARS